MPKLEESFLDDIANAGPLAPGRLEKTGTLHRPALSSNRNLVLETWACFRYDFGIKMGFGVGRCAPPIKLNKI